MPRRRADKVIEHRISLSDGLHKEVKQTLASRKITNQVAMVGNAGKAIMNVTAIAGIGAIAYLGVKAYAEAKGVMPQVKESFQKAWDWGFGVETNADGAIVPTTVVITNAAGNQETVVNPINQIPVLNRIPGVGGLFDWGMKLGAATNPFEGDPVAPPPTPEPDDSIWQAHLDAIAEEERQSLKRIELERMMEESPEEFRALMEEQFGDMEFYDWDDVDFDFAAFSSSWATSMEAYMREEMGNEWVDAKLALDPNFFAWKAFDVTEGIGGLELDFSGLEGMDYYSAGRSQEKFLLEGRSPITEFQGADKRPMNTREWREWVAQVRDLDSVAYYFPNLDLNWNWNEYRAYWQSIWD
jgi:hypothetical protein